MSDSSLGSNSETALDDDDDAGGGCGVDLGGACAAYAPASVPVWARDALAAAAGGGEENADADAAAACPEDEAVERVSVGPRAGAADALVAA